MSQSVVLLVWVGKATALLLLAAGLTFALRRAPAGARYVVWLATLATLLIIPAVSSWAPIPIRVLPASSPAVQAPTAAPSASEPTATPSRAIGTPAASTVSQPASPSTASPAPRVWTVLTIVLVAWAAILAGVLAWLVLGAWTVRRILSRAVPLTDEGWLHPMYDVADRLGLENAPRLVMSAMIEMPFACGLTRPTIVLPTSAGSWSEERRRVVLFHELAHILRRDLVGHTLGRIACALYWFHPLVWSAAKRLRAESERACDDLVLACGGARPSEYANHLLEIVTSIRMQGAPATAMPMADKKEFEGRMLAILDPAITRATPTRPQTALLLAGLFALSFTVAAVTPAERAPVAPQLAASRDSMPTSAGARIGTDTARFSSDTPKTVSVSSSVRTSRSTQTNTLQTAVTRAFTSPQVTSAVTRVFMNPEVGIDMKQQAAVDTALIGKVLRTDKDAVVRKSAAWVLQGHREGVPLLLAALRTDVDDDVREMAAWGLAYMESDDVVAAEIQTLKTDKSAEVRRTAAWALGNLRRADPAALIAALDDQDEDVRHNVLWAIGQHEVPAASPKVVAMLHDESADVRLMAAWVLGELEDHSTIPAVRAAFKSETDSETKQAEFRALMLMGDRSQELIDAAMSSPDADLRARAVQMLAGGSMHAWPWPWPWPWPRPSP